MSLRHLYELRCSGHKPSAVLSFMRGRRNRSRPRATSGWVAVVLSFDPVHAFAADGLVRCDGQAEPQLTAQTTLRYVRSLGKAFIEGTEYPLEPRQQAMLLALINDLDHEMGKDGLKAACSSQEQRFSPSKEFDRNPVVYKTFIRYLRDDERYALIIPDADRDWLG